MNYICAGKLELSSCIVLLTPSHKLVEALKRAMKGSRLKEGGGELKLGLAFGIVILMIKNAVKL